MTMLRQSTAVAIGGRALLLEGPPGAGKSSLALALIDRGAVLVGDDGISIEARFGAVWAGPAPATAGKIELRNVGIATLACTSAPIALVLALGEDAPRYVEATLTLSIAGCDVPCLAFDARGPAAAVRAEYALTMHGLPRADTV